MHSLLPTIQTSLSVALREYQPIKLWAPKLLLMVLMLLPLRTVLGQESSPDFAKIGVELIGQEPLDSALSQIDQLIFEHCKEDSICLFFSYYGLVRSLEDTFNLPAAVQVCLSALQALRPNGVPQYKSTLHVDLYRFYDALHLDTRANQHLDSSIALSLSIQDSSAYIKSMSYRLETMFFVRPEVLGEFKTLMKNAWRLGDTGLAIFMQLELNQLYYAADSLDALASNIDSLEQVVGRLNDPSQALSKLTRISTDKARLYERLGELTSFKKALKDGVRYSRLYPDKWTEIESLQKLARLAWQEDSLDLALSYLKESGDKALALNLFDRLHNHHAILHKINKAQGNYQEAHYHLLKRIHYDSLIANRNSGFNLENYYLELEKKQLAQAKTERELELSLSESRLRFTFAVSITAAILAALLFWAFWSYRRFANELQEQNELIKAQSEELKATEKVKSQFYANISHELRTPLTLILAPLDRLAKSEGLSSKQSDLLSTVNRSVNQLKSLINQLLDFGKLENKNLSLELEGVAIKAYFQNYLSQFESLAHQKGIAFKYSLHLDDQSWVKIDAEKTRQILYNLLSNAFKFTSSGGFIEVTVRMNDSEQLALVVEDSGVGISEEDQKQIFDRYFQSNDPAKSKVGGTGIGLALCKEYAQLMGGDANVLSAPEQGARFTITLNAPAAEMPQDANIQLEDSLLEAEPLNPPLSPKSKHILLVEDNLDLQRYMRQILSDYYRVSIAENGQAALEILAEDPSINLVLSDLMMPVMDGQTLLQNLKGSALTKHLPIILLTARKGSETRLKALRFGVDDYMTKPFDEQELMVRVANLLERQESRNLAQSEAAQSSTDEESLLSAVDQEWLNQLEEYLSEHLQDSDIKVPDIASALSMSESSLLRKLKNLVGITPKQYLQDLRLDYARKLLEEGGRLSIKEIAAKAGYKETRSFSRNYFKRYGKNPSDY